ncbi:uncharacterized protein LOC108151090 [Drosophila miranda]|uniref:uncharacterized protein LOC108151090 n=1 Tax=Drosophila miranda TaxID=7229 RepID=UPI0007E6C1E8|nr:uncharacterized protein LOC108151090 [Drosophila miranda]
MSYQIKSTPFFRRMYNNSQRNGQLQRLREEYERIQEFNDRTIELKMRQVRLKRLFREIEEIKEGPPAMSGTGTSTGAGAGAGPGPGLDGAGTCNVGTSSATARSMQRRRRLELLAPTVEQQQYLQRLNTLARAKELGKEISRRNAELAEAGVGHYLRSDLRLTTKMQAAVNAKRAAADRRERAAKRIRYGNAQSKHNLKRLVTSRLRRLCGGGSTGTGAAGAGLMDSSPGSFGQQGPVAGTNASRLQRPDLTKKAMLKQRLLYGNSRSCSNMRRLRRHNQIQGHGRDQAPVKLFSQVDLLADFVEEGDDGDEEEQGLELPSESSGRLQMAHYTPSSSGTTDTITTEDLDDLEDFGELKDQGAPATILEGTSEEEDGSETEMCTVSRASTSQAIKQGSQCSRQVPMALQNEGTDRVHPEGAVSSTQDNTNNWHRYSLTLPWFKAFPRLLDGTLPVPASTTESIASSSSYEDLATSNHSYGDDYSHPHHQGFVLPPFRFRKSNN